MSNRKVYPPFMTYCAKVIPLAFNESMSYYECICNITNHINNEIIPVVNENSDIVNQNKKDFDELKQYVDDNMLTKDINDLTYYTLTSDLSTVATTGDYNDLINKPTIPTIPTNISSFNNDAGYITNAVNDLTNYTTTTNLTSLLSGKENVIEEVSNTNGICIKLDSGIAIEYGSYNFSNISISNAYGSIYYALPSDQITFPVAFKDSNYSFTAIEQSSRIGGIMLNTKNTGYATIKVWQGISESTASFDIDWIAIGYWK